jgi:hypothetical protein
MSSTGSISEQRTPLWASPGLIVGALFSLLVLLIAIGVVVTNRGGTPISTITIAELRASPERYDNQTVILTGTAEDVRQLPILDQYALYTFRDETGSMWTLSQRGSPPRDGEEVRLTGVFNSRITLDQQIQSLIENQFGSLAGQLAGSILPGLAINAVFIEHLEYELVAD